MMYQKKNDGGLGIDWVDPDEIRAGGAVVFRNGAGQVVEGKVLSVRRGQPYKSCDGLQQPLYFTVSATTPGVYNGPISIESCNILGVPCGK